MKTFVTVGIVVVVAMVIVSSCKKDEVTVSNPPQEFAIRIDTLKIQKPVFAPDTLRAKLWGIIGNSSCYQFARYQEVSHDSFQVTIKVFGTYTPSGSCAPTNVVLNAAIYRVYPVYQGLFRFFVQQPNGTTIRDSIIVQ